MVISGKQDLFALFLELSEKTNLKNFHWGKKQKRKFFLTTCHWNTHTEYVQYDPFSFRYTNIYKNTPKDQ